MVQCYERALTRAGENPPIGAPRGGYTPGIRGIRGSLQPALRRFTLLLAASPLAPAPCVAPQPPPPRPQHHHYQSPPLSPPPPPPSHPVDIGTDSYHRPSHGGEAVSTKAASWPGITIIHLSQITWMDLPRGSPRFVFALLRFDAWRCMGDRVRLIKPDLAEWRREGERERGRLRPWRVTRVETRRSFIIHR